MSTTTTTVVPLARRIADLRAQGCDDVMAALRAGTPTDRDLTAELGSALDLDVI